LIVTEAHGSSDERLRRLEDAEAIRALWHRYLFLFDLGGAHQELGRMFTEDAVLESRGADSGDRAWQGRSSIESEFFRVVSPARPEPDDRVYSGHQGTTFEVDLEGNTARLRGRFFEMTGRGAGTLLAVGGTHTLDLRRGPAGWLIEHLTIQITFCAQFDTVDPRTAFLGKPPQG
jgi:hypothetical protein